jgi:mannose/fructose/N-acetylgalactosamine-specific phosphotransferase system component IIC
MEALGLARLAEIKVGAVGTAVADAANRDNTTAVTLAAPVHVCATAGIVLGDAEQQADDVLTGALVLVLVLGIVIAFVVVPVVVENMFVGNRLAIIQGPDRVDVDVLVAVGLSRSVRGFGRLAVVSASDIRKRAPAVANSIAPVQAAVG